MFIKTQGNLYNVSHIRFFRIFLRGDVLDQYEAALRACFGIDNNTEEYDTETLFQGTKAECEQVLNEITRCLIDGDTLYFIHQDGTPRPEREKSPTVKGAIDEIPY